MAEMKRRSRFRSEAGAEMVELALALPLLLIVITGIVDFAFLLRSYEVATNAAREGARVAILPGYGAGTAIARTAAYVTAGGGQADAAHLTTTVTAVPVNLGAGLIGNGVQVSVTYTHEFLFLGWILGLIDGTFDNSVTFTTSSVMRSEIQTGVPTP
jgi:Flp pilus assembly protein TadG